MLNQLASFVQNKHDNNVISSKPSPSTKMSDPAASMPPAPAAREPRYTNRQTQILAITVCCMILPTLVLILRLLTRLLVKIQLWWDDYCAFAALVRPHGQEEMRGLFFDAGNSYHTQLFTYGANIAVILSELAFRIGLFGVTDS